MNFSPSDIAYYLEVAREGHVGRAALNMGVTQPAVSKALRRLEEAAGVPLVERGSHGARLTADGRLFLESARKLHAQQLELSRVASELRAQHAGLLRVGLTNAGADTTAVRALAEMVRRRPGLRIILTIGRSDALHAAIESGDLDLALVPSYPGRIFGSARMSVGEDPARLVARAQHPIFRMAEPALQDVSNYAWVLASRQSVARRLLIERFERCGLPEPQVALEVDYMSEAAMGLVASTDLLSLAPDSVLRTWSGRVRALAFEALTLQRTLVLLARPEESWSPLMVAFKDQLLAMRQA
jgi:DNA-binding transcriptional LysR family regulator